MENQLLPYRPTHKITIEFKAGGLRYRITDTDHPIDNNEKLSPQLPSLCSTYAGVPESSITHIKVFQYKRYPKVRLPEFDHREPRDGEYWLCAIDGFDRPRVFAREAGGWQIGNEISQCFMGNREIRALSRLYTRREVFDVSVLYRISQNRVKKLQRKLERIEREIKERVETKALSSFLRPLWLLFTR